MATIEQPFRRPAQFWWPGSGSKTPAKAATNKQSPAGKPGFAPEGAGAINRPQG